nr:[Fe-Fe] hydrogenase large subunit C-terminal domain-containing protein [[Clostridium] hylemonae]
MVAALRSLGADYVLDTNFAADLTIMEEASELVERVTKRQNRCRSLQAAVRRG